VMKGPLKMIFSFKFMRKTEFRVEGVKMRMRGVQNDPILLNFYIF
jgi:hypothetical protein